MGHWSTCEENCRELPEIEVVQDVFEFLYNLEEEEEAAKNVEDGKDVSLEI